MRFDHLPKSFKRDHHEFSASIAFDDDAPAFDSSNHSPTVTANILIDWCSDFAIIHTKVGGNPVPLHLLRRMKLPKPHLCHISQIYLADSRLSTKPNQPVECLDEPESNMVSRPDIQYLGAL